MVFMKHVFTTVQASGQHIWQQHFATHITYQIFFLQLTTLLNVKNDKPDDHKLQSPHMSLFQVHSVKMDSLFQVNTK